MSDPRGIVSVEITVTYSSGLSETTEFPRFQPDPNGLHILVEPGDLNEVDYLPEAKRIQPPARDFLRVNLAGEILRDEDGISYYYRASNG